MTNGDADGQRNKGWRGNFFEDFTVGDVLACPTPRTITSGDVATYVALTGDRTPAWCGPSGRVHPLVAFHAVFGQTVRQISLNARANLGYADIRWHRPVFVGDTLKTEIEIVGLKENSSRTTGVVYVRTVGRNQHGGEVLSFARWVMVRKRGAEETPFLSTPVVPELPSSVAAEALVIDRDALVDAQATGGRWRFDDYRVGERIHHYDGVTINPSDHMSFTRLFQNSAKVHFDAIATDGRPLVYGGVVISHGYAASFNGLENRLGICGINAGVHANPTYAGDTLYAFTEVRDAVAIDSGFGALRLRLVMVKNIDPSAGAFEPDVDDPKRPGRSALHGAVVLDLDYWEAMPR